MMFATWLQWLKRGSGRGSRVGCHTTKRRAVSLMRSVVPRLEALEDRTLLSTFTVLNLNDSGPGSLRAAVASGDDTIAFAKGLHGTIVLTSGELMLNNSVTINGPGANRLAVSGNNSSRVFEVAAGLNVAINGLTITHGSAPDQGGGVLNDGANLTLSGDVLSQNTAFESATNGARGGALYSLGGVLTITDSQIIGNQARGATGESAFGDGFGGGLYIRGGSATISDSTISGDLARGGDNSSDGYAAGGGILTAVPTSVSDCTISDNVARAGDNTPDNGAVGGGIDIAASSTAITGSTFIGNQAVGGNGGTGSFVGIAEGGAINSYGAVSISGSTFDQNQALAGSNGNSGVSTFGPFVDYGFGGAIANTEGTISITGSGFSHNQAVGGNDSISTDQTDFAAVGGAEGGALYSEVGSTATVAGSTFDHNLAQGGNGNSGNGAVVLVGEGLGGAIAAGYGGDFFGPNTLTVSDSILTQNDAQGGNNNSGTASVAGLVGAGVGAGIANYQGGTATISDSDLALGRASGGRHNTAGGAGAVFAGLGAGGGIFNYLGNFNSPNYGSPLTNSMVAVSNCVIDLNQAQGGGGGNAEGGGIANLLDATTTATKSVLILNQANGGGGAGLGGGAYNDATSSLALTKALVTLNEADGSPGIGGGVYTLGTFTDLFTLIVGNDASTSGDNIGH
jgi:hypothetical protein